MKSIILTSGPAFSEKKGNGERKAIKLANVDLIGEIKKNLDKYDNILFICSSPDEYEKNEEYASLITKSLSLSGIKFQMSDIIDSRNWLFTKGLINNSDLVVLMGGNPLEQIQFFNDIELRSKLSGYNGCLLTISAGTINMATNAYCSKDEKIEKSTYYKGLGLTDINIDPHFDYNDGKRINEVLLEDSKKRSFIALPDDSFIVIDKNETKLHGIGYYFNNGNYEKIKNINEIKGDNSK